MPAANRAFDQGTRNANRHAHDVADEFRERRPALGATQAHVAAASRMSRVHYGRIESGRMPDVTIVELDRIASVLGLSASIRIYPAGPAVRDAGQAARLLAFLRHARGPLTHRMEVALPARQDQLEQRAWDAVLFGHGARTAIELEMRIRDIQALMRRIDLKRRDDPTDGFLLLVADTRHNRRVLTEFAGLLQGLPRLRPSAVKAALALGEHPGTGIVLI